MSKPLTYTFHIELLKRMVCFKWKGHYTSVLDVKTDRPELLKKIQSAQKKTISISTFNRFWTQQRIKEESLDILCNWLDKDYSWKNFIAEHRSPFNATKPFSQLSLPVQEKINVEINKLICDYRSYEDYKRKRKIKIAEKENDKIRRKIQNSQPEDKFDTSTGNYNILILPFRNPDNNYEKTSLGQNLADGLNAKNNFNKLGLVIRYLRSHSGDTTHKEARKIGKAWEADIVIWGNDSKPNENLPHHIYFNYVSITTGIDSEKIQKEGITGRLETERLVEITLGKLHLEIAEIIYWFRGNKFLLKNDYTNALKNFKKIKNEK